MEPIALQIQRKGLAFDQAQIGKLSAEFRDSHWVRLSQLLEPSILDFLQARLDSSHWETMSHGKIGEEYVTNDLPATSLLHFAMNRPQFRTVIEEITGCKGLRWFRGRVYRVAAGVGHHDNWHDDVDHSNEIGISLNLSRDLFRGGLFMLREVESKRVLASVANTGSGDALIFRISPGLQHRISDLEGAEPKTAFAGWFKSSLPECFKDLGADSDGPAGYLS
jgi:hypothetical protein